MKKNNFLIFLFIAIALSIFGFVTYTTLNKITLNTEVVNILFLGHLISSSISYTLIEETKKMQPHLGLTILQQTMVAGIAIITMSVFIHTFPDQNFITLIAAGTLLLLTFVITTISLYEDE